MYLYFQKCQKGHLFLVHISIHHKKNFAFKISLEKMLTKTFRIQGGIFLSSFFWTFGFFFPKDASKSFEMIFWTLHIPEISAWGAWSIHQMKAKITCHWLMKLVLRFTLKKLQNSSFQKIILKFLNKTFSSLFDFFWKVPKNDVKNRAEVPSCMLQ